MQILALFKGYDLAWPRATSSAMSWSDTANLGITVTAPSCYWASYGYYQSWIITMALPVGCIPPNENKQPIPASILIQYRQE